MQVPEEASAPPQLELVVSSLMWDTGDQKLRSSARAVQALLATKHLSSPRLKFKNKYWTGAVTHTFNSSTPEAEAGRSL